MSALRVPGHAYRPMSDRARCECGWSGATRVGGEAIAREHHRRHKAEVAARTT